MRKILNKFTDISRVLLSRNMLIEFIGFIGLLMLGYGLYRVDITLMYIIIGSLFLLAAVRAAKVPVK